MAYGKKKNIAGMMGAMSGLAIPIMGVSMNVDPMERMMQKQAGRTQGRSMAGVKKKKQSMLGMS